MLATAALVLGACGSGASDQATSDETEATPDTLPYEAPSEPSSPTTAPADNAPADTAPADAESAVPGADEEFSSSSALDDVEITPERFEELKTDEELRAEVLAEMQGEGLTAEQAACFLDRMSLELFVTFGRGEAPDDAEFEELLGLLDTCEIAFGTQS